MSTPVQRGQPGPVIAIGTSISRRRSNRRHGGRRDARNERAEEIRAFVQLTGEASLSADQAELLRWATAIGGRYMGAGRAESFGARNAVEGVLLVRVTPEKTIAVANLAD